MENKINPMLKELEFFIGSWTMELSNASFLPNPETKIKGTASFEWFEEGDILIFKQGSKKKGAPWATWLISRDEHSENYTVLYIDDRRVSRVYEMSFEKNIWKIWRHVKGFMQRFEGKISKDRKTIEGSWEKSEDGKKWEHDFDLRYQR